MKKKQKYYWKVVQVNVEGKFTSCVTHGNYELTYKINEITRPRIGKIFVFKTRQQASTFKYGFKPTEILKVEVNPNTVRLQKVRSDVTYDAYIHTFWKDHNSCYSVSAPRGTYGATWVKPIKIVS
jgi:hypothetical protein